LSRPFTGGVLAGPGDGSTEAASNDSQISVTLTPASGFLTNGVGAMNESQISVPLTRDAMNDSQISVALHAADEVPRLV
jgi:hypothetical protein